MRYRRDDKLCAVLHCTITNCKSASLRANNYNFIDNRKSGTLDARSFLSGAVPFRRRLVNKLREPHNAPKGPCSGTELKRRSLDVI